MNADMQMTADKAGFMERIEENAPDWGQLQEMAMRYGLGNEGRGFNAEAEAAAAQQPQGPILTQNDYRNQGGGGWSPPPGAVAARRNTGPMFVNGFNPMAILNNMAGMGAYRVPWNVNRREGPQDANYAPGATDVPNYPATYSQPAGPQQSVGNFIENALEPDNPYGPQSKKPLPGSPEPSPSMSFTPAENFQGVPSPSPVPLDGPSRGSIGIGPELVAAWKNAGAKLREAAPPVLPEEGLPPVRGISQGPTYGNYSGYQDPNGIDARHYRKFKGPSWAEYSSAFQNQWAPKPRSRKKSPGFYGPGYY